MTSTTGAALTAVHYRHQLAIKAEAVRDAHRLWQTWAPGNLKSWKTMVALAIPLVAARHALSSGIAARYFEQMASLETGRAEAAVVASVLPPEQIAASLAATGLVGTIAAASRGASLEAAALTGFVRFQGGFGRLAMLGGRDTIVASVAGSNAKGWVRVTGDNPCDFCQMLADRGPAYGEATADFQAHDNCSCTAEPAW